MAAFLRLVEPIPNTELVTVKKGGRRSSRELGRTREHLTPDEVTRLATAAKKNRHGHRDALMIMLAFRHGLRATELVELRRDAIDLNTGMVHITRVKNGTSSTQPLQGDTMRALRQLFREAPASPFVFVSERGAPFTRAGFQKMVARAGVEAGFEFGVHPHMLRHATGYAQANRGTDTRTIQALLGHRQIQHTVRYTELSPNRFKDLWK
jgi:type 1 fimbriae regulatory protein FimB/type 1 fimbriae regulatory protein FimE